MLLLTEEGYKVLDDLTWIGFIWRDEMYKRTHRTKGLKPAAGRNT